MAQHILAITLMTHYGMVLAVQKEANVVMTLHNLGFIAS